MLLLCVYNAITDKLSLYNDAGTALIGIPTPGINTLLSNAQGRLNCKNGLADARQPMFLFARAKSNLSDGYDT